MTVNLHNLKLKTKLRKMKIPNLNIHHLFWFQQHQNRYRNRNTPDIDSDFDQEDAPYCQSCVVRQWSLMNKPMCIGLQRDKHRFTNG